MAMNGQNRRDLSRREGAKNSTLPRAIDPVAGTGPVETKISVHGGGNTTNIKVHGSTGAESKIHCHQAQGVDTKIGKEKFDMNFRSQVKGHGGQGPNPCGSYKR